MFTIKWYLPDFEKATPGKVSITFDGWSADTKKAAFQGMTAHWIQVKEGKWKMRAEVIGFKALSGNHGGENLRRYAVGLLDCVGIMHRNGTKVCRFWLSRLSTQEVSFTRRHWIIQVTTKRPVRQLRMFTSIEALNGIVKNNNYHLIFITIIIIWLMYIIPLQLPCARHQPRQCRHYGPHHEDRSG